MNYILLDDEDFCHYLQNSTENFGAIKKYIQNKKEKQKNYCRRRHHLVFNFLNYYLCGVKFFFGLFVEDCEKLPGSS